jgi:hypothetical protein
MEPEASADDGGPRPHRSRRHDSAVVRPHARPMDLTGRPMRGIVYVAPTASSATRSWSDGSKPATTFAASQLPSKCR